MKAHGNLHNIGNSIIENKMYLQHLKAGKQH